MSGLLPKAQHDLRKVHPADAPDRQAVKGAQRSSKKLTQWTIIAEKAGVQNTKERLKSFWTTLGVVSALMAALTYPAVTSPAVTKHDTSNGDAGDPLVITYVLLNTSSLVLSFVVVILSVILLAEVDLVVTDEDLEVFIDRYQYLFLALTGVFGTSILTIIAAIVVIGFYNYNRGTAAASAAICVAGTTAVALVATWVAPWTRSRLRLHISEANTRLRAAVQKLMLPASASAAASGSGSASGSAPGSLNAGAANRTGVAEATDAGRAGDAKGDTLRLKPSL